MPQTVYSDDQVAGALATLQANGGRANKTAKALGIPRTTLRQWAGRAASSTARPKQVPLALVQEAEALLADNWDKVAFKASELLLGKLEGASAYHLALIAGISTDKRQLLR